MASLSMPDRLLQQDWAATPLGARESWPQSLRTAVDICMGSRFPMFVWWGDELINLYNDAYIPVLGDKHPAAFGRPARENWGEIWDVVGAQAEQVMRRGVATWNERVLLKMLRHGYEEDTWFTWSYSPIRDESGAIAGLFCACYEDTPGVLAERERDRLMGEVSTERERLVSAFQNSPSFLALLEGPEHVFRFANERYFQLVSRRDVIGRPVREAIAEVAAQGFVDILDRVYATGEPFMGSDAEVQLRDATGKLATHRVDYVFQPIRSASGAVTGILVVGSDVTERHAAEASFRQLADAMPQIVFSATAEGHVDYLNRKWYEYTGLPDGDSASENWKQVHTPEGLERVQKAWPEALRTGEPYEIEYPLLRHDGEWRWHLARALPIRDEAGRIVRWYGTNTDIHDRKQIEEALAQSLASEQHARTQAETASRMKDEFLATLSHELRTPLNAILGWASMLRTQASNADHVLRGAEVIERNARAQTRIIEDLLDMSAIMSGKVRLEVGTLDIAALAQAGLDTARPTAEAKGVALESRIELAKGEQVRGDPHRLQQVIWNLLSNAIKFTPRGGRVELNLSRKAGLIELAVADSGEGIAPEFLPYVFDRFRQADASTTRRHGGLGLGLSIVKQLVELHGGHVRVESAGRGQGARFTVCLPDSTAVRTAGKPRSAVERPVRAIDVLAEDCERLEGIRVLVVDDDPDARDLAGRLLGGCRADVVTAGSTQEALGALTEGEFDVLISDIGMPGEDGYALLRKVRALPREHNGDIPAMALTAYARGEDRVKALRAGFHLHASKPVDPAELIAAVANLGRLRQGGQRPAR
jgi:PAS domain S-box-containing protein